MISLYLLARLLLSLILLVLLGSVLIAAQRSHIAQGQEQSISTSADDYGGIFFGESVVQVVIIDSTADDSATIEDLNVDVDALPDAGTQGSMSFAVPETSSSSGRFEFFLQHSSASAVDPQDLDPINSRGVEGDGSCVLACAPIVTFGPSGDLQIAAKLYEDVVFDINAGSTETRLNYEEDPSEIELDRTAYGSNSFVYMYILDHDANLNPFDSDEFIVDPDNSPNDDLLTLSGGSIEGIVTFRETGENTARFEGRYELGESIRIESEALILTLFDKANYGDTLDAAENDSNGIDEVSFTIGDSDGSIDVGGDEQETWDATISSDKAAYGLGETARITVEDPDANSTSSLSESVDIELTTPSGTAVIAAEESEQDSGIFTVEITIGLDGVIEGTQLTVEGGDSITVSYIDEKPADYAERLQSHQDPKKEFALDIRVRRGEIGVPAFVTPPAVTGPLNVGTQLALSTIIENNGNSSQPYFVLVEVRDSSDITVYLAWQSGTIVPDGSSTIEVSWTPVAAGEYELRSFAVSSLEEGSVITEVARNMVTIS